MISDALSPFLRQVVTAEPGETAAVAARKLRDARVGCLVVIRAGRVVGVLTDRDLVVRVVAEGRDPQHITVHDVMTRDPYVVAASNTVQAAVRLMKDHGVRRLPIVNDEHGVIGIVTADDLVAELGALIAAIGSAVSEPTDSDDSR